MFRSHQSTEKANQEQHQLHNLGNAAGKSHDIQTNSPQAELHESPRNLLESWHTLRELDADLSEKKPEDAAKKPNAAEGKSTNR